MYEYKEARSLLLWLVKHFAKRFERFWLNVLMNEVKEVSWKER